MSARFRAFDSPVLQAGALAALAVGVYLNALHGGFIYDEYAALVQNPRVQDLSHVGELLTKGVWDLKANLVSNYFRPAQMVGYAIVAALFGMTPVPFHVHSIAFHALTTVAVLRLVRRWTGSPKASVAAGALYAVHPVHTETVSWIAAMPDLGCTLFAVLCLVLLLRAKEAGAGARRIGSIAVAIACFLVALTYKETAVTLLLAWPLIRFSTGGDGDEAAANPARRAVRGRRFLIEEGALAGAFLVYLAWRLAALGGRLLTASEAVSLGPVGIAANAARLLTTYVGRLVWPMTLCFFPPWTTLAGGFDAQLAGGVALLAAIGAAAVVLWRRGERPAASALLFVPITLLPVLNVKILTENPIAERYLYLPSVGLCALAGLGWAAWSARSNRAAFVALVAVLGIWATRTVARNADYRDEVTLFEKTAAQRPDHAFTFQALGDAYGRVGLKRQAIEAYERAQALDPGDPEIRFNLTLLSSQTGAIDPEEAVRRYQEIRAGGLEIPELLTSLGADLGLLGRPGEAIEPLSRAVALDPTLVEPVLNLSTALGALGRHDEAAEVCRRALQLHGRSPEILSNLAIAEAHRGRWSEAEAALARIEAVGGDASRARAAVNALR